MFGAAQRYGACQYPALDKEMAQAHKSGQQLAPPYSTFHDKKALAQHLKQASATIQSPLLDIHLSTT